MLVFQLALEVMNADTASNERRIDYQLTMECRIGSDALDNKFIERLAHLL
jgi:hypothetical protein